MAANPKPLACIEPRLARFVQQQPGNSARELLLRHGHLETAATAEWIRRPCSRWKTLLAKAGHRSQAWRRPTCSSGSLSFSQRNFEKVNNWLLRQRQSKWTHSSGEAHYRLGVAYDRIGSPEKAKQEFQLHDEIEKLLGSCAVERQRRGGQAVLGGS